MSTDLYLMRLRPDTDFDDAMAILDRMEEGAAGSTAGDAREAAQTLMALDPRFRPFAMDYAAIAQYEGISEAEARRRYDHVELDGPEELRLAQFIFYRSHVVIHWYSGTSEEDMDSYLKALCDTWGFALIDPQGGEVYRLGPDGEFQ
jgi:hypothetical protein